MKEAESAASRVRLIVLEEGGELPAFDDGSHAAELLVVTQPPGDTPTEFATRALHRVAVLERTGKFAEEAVIATARQSGSQQSEAREALARGLLRHLRHTGDGVLSLVSSDRVGPDARHELMCLTDKLISELSGTEVGVRLRFERQERERSGTRWKKPQRRAAVHVAA